MRSHLGNGHDIIMMAITRLQRSISDPVEAPKLNNEDMVEALTEVLADLPQDKQLLAAVCTIFSSLSKNAEVTDLLTDSSLCSALSLTLSLTMLSSFIFVLS